MKCLGLDQDSWLCDLIRLIQLLLESPFLIHRQMIQLKLNSSESVSMSLLCFWHRAHLQQWHWDSDLCPVSGRPGRRPLGDEDRGAERQARAAGGQHSSHRLHRPLQGDGGVFLTEGQAAVPLHPQRHLRALQPLVWRCRTITLVPPSFVNEVALHPSVFPQMMLCIWITKQKGKSTSWIAWAEFTTEPSSKLEPEHGILLRCGNNDPYYYFIIIVWMIFKYYYYCYPILLSV